MNCTRIYRCCIRAIVPEQNLPVRLRLHDAGYKAVRVLHRHYGSDDGYRPEKKAADLSKSARELRTQLVMVRF
jgi:hypothetical protein